MGLRVCISSNSPVRGIFLDRALSGRELMHIDDFIVMIVTSYYVILFNPSSTPTWVVLLSPFYMLKSRVLASIKFIPLVGSRAEIQTQIYQSLNSLLLTSYQNAS